MNANKKRLAKDAAAAVLRHAAPAALGGLTLAFTARQVGAAALGFWNLLGAAAFLIGLADLGLSTAVLRAAASTEHRGEALGAARWAARRTALLGVPAAALAALALVLGSGSLLPAERALAQMGIPVALVAGIALAACAPLRSYLHGSGAVAALSAARVLGAAAQCALSLAVVRSLGVLGIALGYAAGVAVELGLIARAVAAAAKEVPGPHLPPSPARRAEYGKIGRSALLANVAVIVSLRLDVFLLGLRFDLGTLAAYATTSRLVDQLYTAVKQLGFALVPRLGGGAEGRSRLARDGAAVLGAVAACGLGAVAAEGPALVRLVAGSGLDATVIAGAAPWLALAAIVAGTQEVPAASLWLGGKPGRAARAMSLGALVNAAVTILAVAVGSLPLAAVATLLGNLVVAIPAMVLAARELGWSRQDYLRALGPAPVALVLCLGLDGTLRILGIPPVARAILASAGAAAAMGGLALATVRSQRASLA